MNDPRPVVFTSNENDQFIDKFIGLNEFNFNKFAIECSPGISVHEAVEHLLRWVRRRAVGRSLYIASEPCVRNSRKGLKWSWVEEYVMKMAFTRKDAETPKGFTITDEYIASFLQRTAEEVKEKRNTKHGIRGFDL